MTKKLFCLTLVVCLIFSLSACSGSSQEDQAADTTKTEETGTAGSNIPLKDNHDEAVAQVTAAMEKQLEEAYGDKIDDARINDVKIYTAEDEQANEALKDYNIGPDEVAFEVSYDLHPAEGADVNELMVANGEYDEESGWVTDKFNLGVLRPAEDGTYTITDFGTGW